MATAYGGLKSRLGRYDGSEDGRAERGRAAPLVVSAGVMTGWARSVHAGHEVCRRATSVLIRRGVRPRQIALAFDLIRVRAILADSVAPASWSAMTVSNLATSRRVQLLVSRPAPFIAE